MQWEQRYSKNPTCSYKVQLFIYHHQKNFVVFYGNVLSIRVTSLLANLSAQNGDVDENVLSSS